MSTDVTTSSPGDGGERHEAQPRRKLLWILIAIVAVGLALLVGWLPRHKRDREVNARAEKQQSTLPVVEVQTVHSASSTQDLTLPGTVTALRIAHIYARASGYLKARYVDLGDTVHKGQLLGIISAPDLCRRHNRI
jgi:multidrug efflux pump subunit AcrA (membrane-fusion protein)